ncbi:NAD(P)/FAD-dependent oxidoreductase [Aquibacillus albus]|uniref:D-amino-acid dehydrogenase n=1 Tax=Aquibacillus albus TaxID=1168171 RepID=A0ABS2MZL8_9BACI|nr:FAD-dependent oxidoreductase [Aquibacillus albus]MBM7571238.1 D-amino-acid dehydrogenase [Aquibacillus albus]
MQRFIVIGAGILGASTAYHLVKLGAEVLLIDRQDSGQATEAAAGIICPWLTNRRNKAWYQLVKEGAKYYPKLINELEAGGEKETGYKAVGAINIFDTEEKLDHKMQMALKRRQSTPEMGEITKLSPKETKKVFPPLSDQYGAVHVSGGARVNGAALRNALIRNAVKNGVNFIHGDASLVVKGSKVMGVQIEGEKFEANQTIVTGGVWAGKLLEPCGIKFLVHSQKAQIVHLHIPDTDTSNWPVLMPPYNQYMLTFDQGKFVVGATQEDDAGLDHRVTMGGVHQIIDKALRVAPGLASSTYVETKVGFRPFTPGYLPIVGRIPNLEGLIVANGLGASGLTSGPFLGLELARSALQFPTTLDLNNYHTNHALG